jgi:hypothetical protein
MAWAESGGFAMWLLAFPLPECSGGDGLAFHPGGRKVKGQCGPIAAHAEIAAPVRCGARSNAAVPAANPAHRSN